jgi:HD-GYP domain-containing protein (c-di-GMP phosphodiesterase class II)
LTEQEIATIRKHPEIGERILSPIIRDPAVLAAIRSHHERFDGDGYPDRLRGDRIPLLARVLAIADCFDAMTHQRAYREAMSPETALDILAHEAGSHFDPQLVPPFTTMIRTELAERATSGWVI